MSVCLVAELRGEEGKSELESRFVKGDEGILFVVLAGWCTDSFSFSCKIQCNC